MNLNKLKVGTRLLGGFAAVSLAGAIVAGIGIVNMGKINDMGDRIYERELLGLSYVKEANINLVYVGRALRSMLLASSEQERAKHTQRVEEARRQIRSNLAEADKRFFSPEGRALLAGVVALRGLRPIRRLLDQEKLTIADTLGDPQVVRLLCPDVETPKAGGLRDLQEALCLASDLGEEESQRLAGAMSAQVISGRRRDVGVTAGS